MSKTNLFLTCAASVLAAYAAALLFETDFAGHGCCGLTWPTPNPGQAERLAIHDDPRGGQADLQRQTALLTLKARPGDSNGWLRLAYADALQHGALTEAGRKAFDTSYLLLPYGGSDTPWRVVFALDHWDELDAQGRAGALAELRVMDKDDRVRGLTRIAGRSVRNPAGRVAATLLGLEPPDGFN
jgi:hypothetical protein